MKNRSIYLFIAIAITLFYFIWLIYSPVAITTVGASMISILAPTLSISLQIYTYYKTSGPKKKFVLFFIFGTVSYIIAELIWTIQTLVMNHELPFPGFSDLFYILSTILFISAFFYLVAVNSERSHFISFLLDLKIIYFTLVSIVFFQVFVPLFQANGLSFLEALATSLYPVLSFLLLFGIVISFIFRKNLFSKPTMILFIAAASSLFIAEAIFQVIYYQALFSINSLIEPLWSLNILLFGIAVAELSYEKNQIKQNNTQFYGFKATLIRMIVQSICVLMLFYMVVQNNNFFYIIILFIIFLLVFTRQILSSYRIHSLLGSISKMNNNLEQKVDIRTKELSEKNAELNAALDKINYMVFHDELTELANRRAFHEKIQQLKRKPRPFALLFMDVNKFKEINDRFGHANGDEVLKIIAIHLESVVCDVGTIYRHAGDEFIIIIEEDHIQSLDDILAKINGISASSIEVFEHVLFLSFSIGIANYPEHTKDIDELIKLADMAMYKSKKGAIDYCYHN